MTEVQTAAEIKLKHWYVINAYSGYEKKVAELLKEKIEQSDHKDCFGDVLVPAEEVVEMKAGQTRRRERKFFPGYILVHMEMNDTTWQIVNSTPRIKGFVGGKKDKPIPISQEEAKAILDRIQQGNDSTTPQALFSAGEIVRIIDGPFVDFNGLVEEVNYEKSRLVVSVTIFGRSTPVELDFVQVEKG
ncbi:MAG: transcription termination/antitermination protein NusG [Gammaproteobacteria bacterium]|nr:transcription termination/antitermination protein NusG [Gammaproteobacteria bacterium]